MAAAMKSGATKLGATKTSAGGTGAPSPLQPDKLVSGNLAHELIGDVYCTLNSTVGL